MRVFSRFVLFASTVCALTGSAPAQTQEPSLEKSVSLTMPATRLPSLLKELGTAAGVKLTCSADLDNEPVIVSIKDEPCTEVMAKLAEVLHAEWVKSGDGFLLKTTPKSQDEIAKAHFGKWTKQFEAGLAKIAKEVADSKPFTLESAREAGQKAAERRNALIRATENPGNGLFLDASGADQSHMPAEVAASKLLLTIPASTYANLPVQSRTVFAITPTRVQRALPAKALAIIRQFEADHRLFAKAFAETPKDVSNEETDLLDSTSQIKPINSPISEVLVIVHRQTHGNLFVTFYFADRNGEIVANATKMVNAEGDQPPQNPFASQTGNVEISETSRKHAELLNYVAPDASGGIFIRMGTGFALANISIDLGNPGEDGPAVPKPKMDSFWRGRFEQFDSVDMLAYGLSEALIQIAERNSKNLVASLADVALLDTVSAIMVESPSVKGFLGHLANSSTLRETERWLLVEPKDIYEARRERINRVEAARMVRSIKNVGRLTLESACNFSLTVNRGSEPSHALRRMIGLIDQPSGQTFSRAIHEELDTAQLFALLPANRRVDEQMFRLDQFSPQQSRQAYHLVYDSFDGPMVRQPEPTGETRRSVIAFATEGHGFYYGGSPENLADERTEFLPNGVPREGTLKLKIESSDVLLASTADGETKRFFSPEEYGMFASISETEQPALQGANKFTLFQSAKRNEINFVFDLAPRTDLNRFLQDQFPASNRQPVSFDQLPAEIQKRAKASRARISLGSGPPLPPTAD